MIRVRFQPQLLVGFALGVLGGCASPDREFAVADQSLVGGVPASATAWAGVLWLESGCTATLIHERIVLFAAHCGTQHSAAWVGHDLEVQLNVDAGAVMLLGSDRYRRLAIESCAPYPETGVDLAYCILTDPVDDIPIVPPMTACERAMIRVGTQATLVGFGFGDNDAGPGTKRVGESTVRTVGGAFIVGDDEVGTCRGDSGGPAFVRFDSAVPAEQGTWRLLGVLSSGRAGSCGPGRYVDVSAAVAGLEAATGYDLTPCNDQTGAWRSGPQCTKPTLDAQGEPIADSLQYADTCGSPYVPEGGCSVHNPRYRSAAPFWWLGVLMAGRWLRRLA